ncbi:MAG: hypothetical protein QG596_21 [Actinomycetota bacterium]|jgi:membrane protein YdbS with pleckstrin-like domain|nr:hypothetical protein [Actinomycetota bacterium]
MAEKPARNRDGSRINSQEYVTLALCVIVPIIGLLFAIYAKSQHEPWASRAIIFGIVALIVWTVLIFTL